MLQSLQELLIGICTKITNIHYIKLTDNIVVDHLECLLIISDKLRTHAYW